MKPGFRLSALATIPALLTTMLCLSAMAQQPIGYPGSVPVSGLSSVDKTRIRTLPLQDLFDHDTGRYAVLAEQDGIGYWSLEKLWDRRGASNKPYADLRDIDDIYQTERVVFADPTTGTLMMRLTNQPYNDGGDEILYFGKSNWSANGAHMHWIRSADASLWGPGGQATTAEYGPLLLDGDGTRPRIAWSDAGSVSHIIAHPFDADYAYARVGGSIVELSFSAESVVRTVAENAVGWWMKMSPDGNYVCGNFTNYIRVTAIDNGTTWDIPKTSGIHDSYRFVPGNTDWVMFWYEGDYPNTQIANFKTGELVEQEVGHDWNHGDLGRHYGVHTSGKVWDFNDPEWTLLTGLTWPELTWQDYGPWYDQTVHSNGYLAHWPDDALWSYPTRIVERSGLSEISSMWVKPFSEGGRTNRFRVALTNLWRFNDRQGNETEVLDRPNISTDGTKILFNTNAFGVSDVYMTQVKAPLPPVDLSATWNGSGVDLSWSHPTYHQEIKGYRVYRSTQSGLGFELLNNTIVEGTSTTDSTALPGQAYFYALKSAEYSKLESGLSDEAAAASDAGLISSEDLRLFVEAERAIKADLAADPPDGLWLNIEGMASNLNYIWQRRSDITGSENLSLNIPRTDDYYVFARIKGDTGATFSIAGQSVTVAANTEWQWVRSNATAALSSGNQTITISSASYGSRLDCFYLSTDADFVPEGRISTLPPAQLTLSGSLSGDTPLLQWSPSQDNRFYYYNLYCGNTEDFAIGQASLIGSPDGTQFLDWQALSGTRFYKLTQVTLDGLESEPSPGFNPAGDAHPPLVNPGPDQTITWPVNSVTLAGSATDPDNDPLTTTWLMESGPASVEFENASSMTTTATFSEPGLYFLRLEASDGTFTAGGIMRVTVSAEAEIPPDGGQQADGGDVPAMEGGCACKI